MKEKLTVGFIGQGFVGKNYADDFERRGFIVLRYALEEPYQPNKEKIAMSDVVFIAVPTPTTPRGFDPSIIKKVITLVGQGKIAVIKSTILPGTTEEIQRENPDITVLYSPEFLSEATAAHDTANPSMNIIGISNQSEIHREAAEKVLGILPQAPFSTVCSSKEAEMIKYAHNTIGYVSVVFVNLLYNLANNLGADWQVVKGALKADPMMPKYHLEPVHKTGRGAGGHCHIKDFAALVDLYKKLINDPVGIKMLEAIEQKNIALLLSTNKDRGLLSGVYGKKVLDRGNN